MKACSISHETCNNTITVCAPVFIYNYELKSDVGQLGMRFTRRPQKRGTFLALGLSEMWTQSTYTCYCTEKYALIQSLPS